MPEIALRIDPEASLSIRTRKPSAKSMAMCDVVNEVMILLIIKEGTSEPGDPLETKWRWIGDLMTSLLSH
jgi:hypothetical protein